MNGKKGQSGLTSEKSVFEAGFSELQLLKILKSANVKHHAIRVDQSSDLEKTITTLKDQQKPEIVLLDNQIYDEEKAIEAVNTVNYDYNSSHKNIFFKRMRDDEKDYMLKGRPEEKIVKQPNVYGVEKKEYIKPSRILLKKYA